MQRLCDWVKGRSISVSYIYIYYKRARGDIGQPSRSEQRAPSDDLYPMDRSTKGTNTSEIVSLWQPEVETTVLQHISCWLSGL